MEKKICIVQTSTGSSKELMDLCNTIIPDVKVYQIIDDSMLPEMVSEGKVTKNVKRKLFNYYEQACKLDVDAILHQCVIAGNVALELNDYFDVPIVRIDEGMLRKALATSNNIAIFATVKAAMSQSVAYLKMLADQEQKSINIKEYLVTKDDIAAQAKNASDNNEIIVLAQPSMTSFLPLLEAENIHALSAPESGIEYLAKILDSKQ